MSLPHRIILAISFASAPGAAVAQQPVPAPAIALSAPDPTIALEFCKSEPNKDSLFHVIQADQVCASPDLRNLVKDERERVSLSIMASSYLAAAHHRRSTKLELPLPLQVLGTMAVETVQDNNEARRGFDPALPRPSSLAQPELSNEPEPVNWATEGLFRAQKAGSCEAVTVGLFKRLSRDATLNPGQRLMASRMLRALGIAAFHPDDSCLRVSITVNPKSVVIERN